MPTPTPTPTHADARYGPHERNVLDLWQAPGDGPAPLAVFVHGGSWRLGDKETVHNCLDVAALLAAGISVATIHYRFVQHADGVTPPVAVAMHDAARAIQFLRHKAREWRIDPARVAAAGESAGGCTALWLAYHDDLRDPDGDAIAQQSTRLSCVAGLVTQTTLDPRLMMRWTANSCYGFLAFGLNDFAELVAERDAIIDWIDEYSPYSHVDAGDPPVCLFYEDQPKMGDKQGDPVHTVNFGIGLRQRCSEVGAECEVVYPGVPDAVSPTATDYLIRQLTPRGDA